MLAQLSKVFLQSLPPLVFYFLNKDINKLNILLLHCFLIVFIIYIYIITYSIS